MFKAILQNVCIAQKYKLKEETRIKSRFIFRFQCKYS